MTKDPKDITDLAEVMLGGKKTPDWHAKRERYRKVISCDGHPLYPGDTLITGPDGSLFIISWEGDSLDIRAEEGTSLTQLTGKELDASRWRS